MRATRLGVNFKPSRSGFSPTAFNNCNTESSRSSFSIPLCSSSCSLKLSSKSSISFIIGSNKTGLAFRQASWFLRCLALTNFRLDQAVSPIPATVQHFYPVRISVEENKEIIVSQHLHLLDGLGFIHRHECKFFATNDHEFIIDCFCFYLCFRRWHDLSRRTSIASTAITLAFIAVDLALHFVQRRVEG